MYLSHAHRRGWDIVSQKIKLTRISKWRRIRELRCRWIQRFCQKTGKQTQCSRRTIHSRDRSPDRQLDAPQGWNRKPLSLTISETCGAACAFFFFSFKRNAYARATHRAASRANVTFWATPTRSEKQLLRTRPRIETLLIYSLACGGYNIDRSFFIA